MGLILSISVLLMDIYQSAYNIPTYKPLLNVFIHRHWLQLFSFTESYIFLIIKMFVMKIVGTSI